MIKNQILLTIISIMFLVISCDKSSINYPITYTSHSITGVSINIFTKSGEIVTPSIKNELIKKYENYLTDLDIMEIEGKLIVTYLSSGTIELVKFYSGDSEIRTVHEIAGLTYWEKTETDQISSSLDFNNKHLSYHPLFFEESFISGATGFIQVTKLKECYYAKKIDNKILIPMLDYFHKTNYGYSSASINNAFNTESFSNLGVNDTLIVQEYYIEMK